MTNNSFLGLIEQSFRINWDAPAMTDFEGKTFYYKEFAREIDQLHEYFKIAGIKRGDKISICGRNSAHWAIAFFATLSYGAVAVSILHEFDKDSVQFIVDHSDSKIFFTDESIWSRIDASTLPNVENYFSLDNFSLLKTNSDQVTTFVQAAPSYFEKKYEKG
jgi:long-chain acyl-CoA synthetase